MKFGCNRPSSFRGEVVFEIVDGRRTDDGRTDGRRTTEPAYTISSPGAFGSGELKKISDVVTLGTFCYRDQSFINSRGSGYFFHGRRGTELDPPPPPHTHTASRKNSDPL